ncbi:hypothetical protein L6270_04205 [Candidatus Parcubacteria bacterium]|nr:hypothetical protein [Patescibacteria group bacterium]MBU4309166.1 hypothetical protein [Patescibacteria group bacterium]MBU4432689.1 hypothetical protein [Patescibacteria group bacterium]MBU4577527.1 hypothetical protein [Patescibacteria group bacterium]MCG2697214.1 hypothetical protein [Candidatus Parcubacteria bacterium]
MKNLPEITELKVLFLTSKFLSYSFFVILFIPLAILTRKLIDPGVSLSLDQRITLIEFFCFSGFVSFFLNEVSKIINKRIQAKN